MLGSLVATHHGYVRTSTTRRSSPNRLEIMDFDVGSYLLRDVRLGQPIQVKRSVKDICASLWCATIQQSPRIFASPDESSWQEYSSTKDIPRWPEWTESASVWLRSDSPTLVFVAGVGKDFTDYYYYCFNRQGALIRVERQFRTAWRWGFTETISNDDKGNEEERTSSYFDTKNEQAIEPPEKSDLVTPLKIFRTVSSLPFFALLSAKDHRL
jgi:hypothetical protein